MTAGNAAPSRRASVTFLEGRENGSPLLKRFHRRGRPKGLSLLFAVLVNDLECVELGLQLLNTFIPLLNLFLERLHLA